MKLLSRRWWKLLAFLALACAVALLAIQAIRPPLTNPPVTADFSPPAAVKQIITNSCYDCHSNQTKLLWFDRIVPAYWLVVHDVTEGRAHLNFSDFGKRPPDQQAGILFEAVSQIQLGAMPPRNYLMLHPEAAVSAEQLATLKKYLVSLAPSGLATAEQITVGKLQYDDWVEASSAAAPTRAVKPSPNGIAFPKDYKDWKAISSTERFDNGTLREILGNDVAVKAIASGQVNPWPDGTMFAKVAWAQEADPDGVIRTGAFKQVEFMIRDSQKYASTKGWGWARWLGTDLQPYGKDNTLATSCISCHMPVQDSDFVFTLPIQSRP